MRIADDLVLWLRLMGMAARARMQYRADLCFQIAAMAITSAADFLAVWVIIAACSPRIGWTLPEACLLYGTVLVPFGLVQLVNAGLEGFDRQVRRGDADLLLLRPRPLLLLVSAADLPIRQLGRVAQAAAVLGYALAEIPLGGADWALLAWAMAGSVVLYLALDLLRAASAFWTVQGLEAWNVLTYGGSMAATWPAEIYRPALRTLLLTVLPVAAVGWLPVAAVLGKPTGLPGWTAWAAPLAGGVFLAAGLLAWRAGVRRYASTGS